jgi:hypothetical protein
MRQTLRSLALLAALFPVGAAISFASEIKDRQVRPAFDLSSIQMPVEIVSIKLNGKEIQPGEKIQGNDDWLQGLGFTLKNISEKPIAYVNVILLFPQPNGFVGYSLAYGVDSSNGSPRLATSPPPILPGANIYLSLSKDKYPGFLRILDLGGAARSFDTAPYYLDKVCFEGEPDLLWSGGMIKRRDPNNPTEFKAIARYVLPVARK